jgi:hypothetical protein
MNPFIITTTHAIVLIFFPRHVMCKKDPRSSRASDISISLHSASQVRKVVGAQEHVSKTADVFRRNHSFTTRRNRKNSAIHNGTIKYNNTLRSSSKRWARRCLHPEGCLALSKQVIYGDKGVDAQPQFCKDHRGTHYFFHRIPSKILRREDP